MATFHRSIGEGKSIDGEFEAKVTAGETISIDVDSAGSLICVACGVDLHFDHNLEVEEGETKGVLTCKAKASGWFKFIYTGFNADGPGHFTADGFDEVKQDKKPKPADLIPKILFSPATLKFFGSDPKGTVLTTKAWVTGSAEDSTPKVQSTGSIAPITLSASGQQGTAELVKPDHPHEIRTSFVATAVAVKRIYKDENPSDSTPWPVESEERVNISADCLVIFSPTEEGATVITSYTTMRPSGVGPDATVELIRPSSHPYLSHGLIYYVYNVEWEQKEYLVKEKRNASTGALIEVVSEEPTGKTFTQTKTMTGSYYYSGQGDGNISGNYLELPTAVAGKKLFIELSYNPGQKNPDKPKPENGVDGGGSGGGSSGGGSGSGSGSGDGDGDGSGGSGSGSGSGSGDGDGEEPPSNGDGDTCPEGEPFKATPSEITVPRQAASYACTLSDATPHGGIVSVGVSGCVKSVSPSGAFTVAFTEPGDDMGGAALWSTDDGCWASCAVSVEKPESGGDSGGDSGDGGSSGGDSGGSGSGSGTDTGAPTQTDCFVLADGATTTSRALSASATTVRIFIMTNAERATYSFPEPTPDWVAVSGWQESGTGGKLRTFTATFSISENVSAEARSTTISCVPASAGFSASRYIGAKITFTQAGADAEDEPEIVDPDSGGDSGGDSGDGGDSGGDSGGDEPAPTPVLTVEPESLAFPSTGGTAEIKATLVPATAADTATLFIPGGDAAAWTAERTAFDATQGTATWRLICNAAGLRDAAEATTFIVFCGNATPVFVPATRAAGSRVALNDKARAFYNDKPATVFWREKRISWFSE